MINRLLCALGFHRWYCSTWAYNGREYVQCSRCGKIEEVEMESDKILRLWLAALFFFGGIALILYFAVLNS